MGNNHSRRSSKSSKSSKSSRKSKSLSSHERFFIAHHKAQRSVQKAGDSPDVQMDLQQRVIFISIMGLYQSWLSVPSTILYSSIFILPLKKQWVYSDKFNYQHDFARILHDTDFVKLLKWKDAQGLVFWMKDAIPLNEYNKCRIPSKPDFIENDGDDHNIDCTKSDNDSMEIAPFWTYLSYKLSALYDPVTGKNYKPLLLNDAWWRNEYKVDESQFNCECKEVQRELYYLTMKFKTISEILYQSNQTLNVVTTFAIKTECSYNDEVSQTQKSYNSLPDHKLIEIGQGEMETNLDTQTHPQSTPQSPQIIEEEQEEDETPKITPNPSETEKNQEKTKQPEPNQVDMDNVWWVSTEYDEVIDVHTNDSLHGSEEEEERGENGINAKCLMDDDDDDDDENIDDVMINEENPVISKSLTV